VPEGREMSFRDFNHWFARHRTAIKLKDPHRVFEEFQGVITGSATNASYLSREDYLDLGIRQSIFSASEREQVYDLFLKYLDFMREDGFYDANILSHKYLPLAEPRYDFIVVDEVQDLTNIPNHSAIYICQPSPTISPEKEPGGLAQKTEYDKYDPYIKPP
jgi:hypothetical protein